MTIEAAEFKSRDFFRSLKGASIRLQRTAQPSAERNLAIDEIFDLIRQAKNHARFLTGGEKQIFLAKVEAISGLKVVDEFGDEEEVPVRKPPAPSKARDPDLITPDLSGRLPRYVRPPRPGDPEMRVIQMAVKRQDGATMILVIGEANNVFYVTQGALGGEYQTWETPHIGEAGRRFSTLRSAGYQEVSPGELRHHRSKSTVPTGNFPNRRRLAPNSTRNRRRKSDAAV